jgi:hypothetical protein
MTKHCEEIKANDEESNNKDYYQEYEENKNM